LEGLVVAAGYATIIHTRLAMQMSIAALARSVIKYGRPAATRIESENAFLDFAAAADLRASAIGPSITARVVPAVDDSTATAARIRAIGLRHDRSIAAFVGLIVVDRIATAVG